MSRSTKDDRIVVGVDFGTTFSGLAFTYCGDPDSPDNISVVKNWPGGNNTTYEKVPSELAYTEVTTASSSAKKRMSCGRVVPATDFTQPSIIWGYQINPDQARLHYLKLLLDPSQNFPAYAPKQDLLNQLMRFETTSSQAITDYLLVLYHEAREALVRRFGASMVEHTRIDLVMTVPAVWSDTAKDATLRAAENAGLGPNISMISEPEAAATYALKSMEHHLLVPGDNFIVCDAGGGTVDLISYEIKSLSPLRIEESVQGVGDLAGSAFLNIRFKELIKKRMSPKSFERMCERSPKSWATALKNFEDHVKRNFDPSSDPLEYDTNNFFVPLPGIPDNPEAGILEGFITLSTAEVAEIFRPIVDVIIELVERQRAVLAALNKIARGVILVGGFGQSNYLYKSLKTRFAQEDPPPPYKREDKSPTKAEVTQGRLRFVIMQPANAWTAVVRGAVISGTDHAKLVLNRKARRHYGVRCSEEYDPTIHSKGNRYWDSVREEFYACNQIVWYVKKGQSLPSGQPILVDFSNSEELRAPTDGCYISEIVVSDEVQAPKEFKKGPKTRILCKIEVDGKQIPKKCWKQATSSKGKRIKELNHVIGMDIASGGMFFDYRVDKVVYGTVRADFE